MIRICALFSLLFLISVGTLPVLAGEENKATEQTTEATPASEKDGQKVALIKAENPHLEKIDIMAKELAAMLSENDADRFVIIKNNFGMVRAIKIARTDIQKAVKACSKANPDMTEEMNARFSNWDKTVGTALDDHEKKMSDSITKSFETTQSKKVQSYLKLIDKAANFADNQIEKTPVTTPKACSSLEKSMDRTEEQLGTLLSEINWPPTAQPTEKDE